MHRALSRSILKVVDVDKPTVPKPTSPMAEPKPKIEADIAIEKQKKKEALERKEEEVRAKAEEKVI